MLPSFPDAVADVAGNFSHVARGDTVLSNRCRSSGKLSKLWVVSWRFAFELIEGSGSTGLNWYPNRNIIPIIY